jgi:hypothetical protein
MKNDKASINEVLNLRQKQKRSKGMNNQRTDNEIIRLVHELEVHQIKERMKLLLAQSQADSATKKK